jgi:myo-inositol-1(or 4)-monophosphatase
MKTHCHKIIALIKENLVQIVSLRGQLTLKADNSYVSQGDLLVQQLVLDYLTQALPAHQLISEELAPFNGITWDPQGSYVVLDPIDGTENFVSGLKEWGIGISIYTRACIKSPASTCLS